MLHYHYHLFQSGVLDQFSPGTDSRKCNSVPVGMAPFRVHSINHSSIWLVVWQEVKAPAYLYDNCPINQNGVGSLMCFGKTLVGFGGTRFLAKFVVFKMYEIECVWMWSRKICKNKKGINYIFFLVVFLLFVQLCFSTSLKFQNR